MIPHVALINIIIPAACLPDAEWGDTALAASAMSDCETDLGHRGYDMGGLRWDMIGDMIWDMI